MWCLSVYDAETDDVKMVMLTENQDFIIDAFESYLLNDYGYEYQVRFVEKVEVTKNGKC